MRSIIVSICLILTTSFAAQADDPYLVTGVVIDATSSNAFEAQSIAMGQGQAVAARTLINRLTLIEDRQGTALDTESHMNELGELVPGRELEASVVAEMISGLEILNEQRSATRYIAELEISFDPRAVERVLTSFGVPFVDAQSRFALVLPVLDVEGQFILWDDNSWQNAWTRQSFLNSLTPMIVPESGPAERSALSARAALSLDEAGLRRLAGIYAVNRIVILRAQEREGIRRFGGYLVTLMPEEMQVETWGPETVYGGWSNAAREFVTSREDSWKRDSIVRDGMTQSMQITVLYAAHGEWQSLQEVLTGASLVEDARLDAVSRDGALMTVGYRGDLEQLVSELAERGAALEEHPGLGWVVRTAF